MPSVAAPTVSTLVPQNHNSNNRSASSNSSLRQLFYPTVEYSTPPLLTVGTEIPCGPVPDSFFNGSPLQASQAQISLPEFPSRASVPSAPQTSSLQPSDSFKDKLASILREFGLEPKSKARAYQKPYPDYFDSTPYPRGFRIPDFVKFTGEDGRSTFEHIGQVLAQCCDKHIGCL